MGIKEIRDAFNEVTGNAANCVTALMEYKPSGGVEYQILYFSGNYADGSEFVVQSDLVRPSGDLIAMARATAANLLKKGNSA